MIQYKITLSRYKDGQLRLSTPQWVVAVNFDDAVLRANMILIGARGIDPDADFAIHAVEQYGSHGTQCDGVLLFETAEEFSARLQAKKDA